MEVAKMDQLCARLVLNKKYKNKNKGLPVCQKISQTSQRCNRFQCQVDLWKILKDSQQVIE